MENVFPDLSDFERSKIVLGVRLAVWDKPRWGTRNKTFER
jgi:hypothetical protein